MRSSRSHPQSRPAKQRSAAELGRVTRRWLAGLGAGAALGALPFAADAQMVGGTVTHGSATVTQHRTATGTHTRIETGSHRTRMEWKSHDVFEGDSLHIQQPGRRASYLAQVSDAGVTHIDGLLTSNGQVWIANPAGVFFGGSAVVDVARLVAGAGDISQRAFVAGARHFTNLRGEVRNDGTIVADGVSLIGRTVANHGQIVARRGDIVLAAGDDVWVRRHDTHIEVRVPNAAGAPDEAGDADATADSGGRGTGAGVAPTGPAVENTGLLETTGRGRARLAAGDFLGLAIRNSGDIHARRIAMRAGEGSVVDVSGTLDVSTDSRRRAGHVEIEADVIVVDDALIDATGPNGGGRVRIGGEVAGGSGAEGEVRNARAVFIGEDAEIRADATGKGDGGSVVVWSDELTVAEGTISARGGPEGGDGGFIETSSKARLVADVDADVSAPAGRPGTWLLDPINVDIVDALSPGLPELTEVATQGVTIFDYLPEITDREIPPVSEITSTSLVDALVRGGSVVVTTESRFLTLTGTGVGDINVNAPIVVPDDAEVRANGFSRLFLLAANDIDVNADIGTAHDNLVLSLDLQANNNEAAGGQREDESQQTVGRITIDADIATNGGSILAEGTDVEVTANAFVDASSGAILVDPDDDGEYDVGTGTRRGNGGLVELIAFDLSGSGQTNTVVVSGRVRSEAGIVETSGDTFQSAGLGSIETAGIDFRTLDEAPEDQVRLGRIALRFNEDVDVAADMDAERIDLDAGRDRAGTLTLGDVTLRADVIDLSAASLDSTQSDGTSSIEISPTTLFEGTGGNADNLPAPSEFRFVQDAPVEDDDIPAAGAFGPNGVEHVRYGIESVIGATDPAAFDLVLSTPAKVDGADLALVVPDSVDLQGVFTPKNLALTVRQGFTVSTDLADAMRPTAILDADLELVGGELRVHGGADGEQSGTPQHLRFADGVVLEADSIVLQAGVAGAVDSNGNVLGDSGQVFARNTDDDPLTPEDESVTIAFRPGSSLTILQDADVGDANIPLASQIRDGVDLFIDYAIQSEGGTITLDDASRVAQSDLVLTALGTITLNEDVSVYSADLGSFDGFTLTESLLDRVTIENGRGTDPAQYARTLKLRANGGLLNFQSADPDDPDVPVQLRVEADRIELIGQTIDVASGLPLFQKDDFTSPERLIFNQTFTVGDSSLPSEENYPDGLGPSELFVVRSTTSIVLNQRGLQLDGTPGAEMGRFWDFPIQDGAGVILTGSSVTVRRTDGYNLVLGPDDQIWSTAATLLVDFAPTDDDPLRPIGFGAVDATNTLDGALRGFDLGIDFTETAFGTPTDADGDDIVMGTLTISQLSDFLLDLDNDPTGDVARLPRFEGSGNLALQPETYALITLEGRIRVENDLLAQTNLQLGVATEQTGQSVDFEDETLNVTSLDVQVAGALEVDDDTDVVAEERIRFISDTLGDPDATGADLSFGTNVRLEARDFELLGGGPNTASPGVVDAFTNSPEFHVLAGGSFTIQQGGVIRNGAKTGAGYGEIDWGRVPAVSQFMGTEGNLELYRLESRGTDVEINDPTEVLIARRVQLVAGNASAEGTLTLRADPRSLVDACADEAVCGDAPGTPTDLVLIQSGGPVESLELQAANVSLEAPQGEVDAGDNRVVVTLFGDDPSFAIRQQDPITAASAEKLTDQLLVFVTIDPEEFTREVPYLIQSLGDLSLGEALAERVTGTDLVLVGGVTDADFGAAEGATRGQPPIQPPVVGDPPQVYDRFADTDGDGFVGPPDAAQATTVAIDDAVAFNLDLRTLLVRSQADDDLPIRLGSVTIRTESDQIFEDEILLVGDVDDGNGGVLPTVLTASAGLLEQITPLETADASSIVFLEEVSAEDGDEGLVVEATNRVRFAKDIGQAFALQGGSQAMRLGSLTINLQQLLQFNDPPPIPRAEFGGLDPDGNPTPGTFTVAAREVRLNPQDPEADGSDSIFTRSEVPDSATFFRFDGDLVFDVQGTGGEAGIFEMGPNEKLTVTDSELRILAPGGTVTIGDLSATDRIEVDASRIQMLRRKGSAVVRANGGGLGDSGVDYVAAVIDFHDGGVGHQSDDLRRWQVGDGRDAKFGIASPGQAPAFMNDFSVTSLQYNILQGDIGPAGSRVAIDGIPDGISRRQLGETYPDRLPAVPLAVPAAYRVKQPELLRDVGIHTRVPTRDELHAAAAGAATFRDLGSLRGTAADPRLRVSEVRLVAQEVELAVRLHDEVFAPDGSRAPEVREILQRALDDYRLSTGARRVVGFELRRYVYNRPSSQFAAYQELQKLDSLFRHHRRSGLTATEYRRVQLAWLDSIRPEGITVEELSEFVHPSRYVRGSDVLDVFGD